ncbi:C-GCAxxG-C-C family protein [Halanaerobium saccharolyticum]
MQKNFEEADPINLNQIKKKAENYYRNGDFYCSESIVKTFIEEFSLDLSNDAVAMASAFPVGMGNSGCSCGAVIGAQMMLGYFFGRRQPGDKKVDKTMELAAELHDYFRDVHGSLCCRVLTKDHKLGSKDHIKQCVSFTGEMAYVTAKKICEELDLKYID